MLLQNTAMSIEDFKISPKTVVKKALVKSRPRWQNNIKTFLKNGKLKLD